MAIRLGFSGKITLLSPLAHNSDESMGTDTKIRRISIVSGGKTIRIPDYSGNAFRGILRRIAARQFCDLLGLEKSALSDALYYTWFCGGSLKKHSKQDFIEVGQKRELREKIPFLSLFGAALQNQIVAGKMQVGIAWPICKETAHLTGIYSTLTIWELTDEVFYTRRDDLEDPKTKRAADDSAQQMKYTIEVLSPGVELAHKFVLNYANDVEASCFGHAIREMVAMGHLGGKSATGHGDCRFDYAPEWPDGEDYRRYIEENKAAILEYVGAMSEKI